MRAAQFKTTTEVYPEAFNGGTVVAPNALGGTAGGYFGDYEEQCGWILHTCTGCVVTSCAASYTYGDGAEVAGASSNITIDSNNFHHIGRQGVAVVRGTYVLIEDNDVHYASRSCFDLEPAGSTWVVDNVTIRGNRIGGFINVFIAALGSGDVNNVLVEDNIVDVPAQNALVVSARGPQFYRRRNWIVRRNVESAYTGAYGGPLAVMRFSYIDSVQCYENIPRPIMGYQRVCSLLLQQTRNLSQPIRDLLVNGMIQPRAPFKIPPSLKAHAASVSFSMDDANARFVANEGPKFQGAVPGQDLPLF